MRAHSNFVLLFLCSIQVQLVNAVNGQHTATVLHSTSDTHCETDHAASYLVHAWLAIWLWPLFTAGACKDQGWWLLQVQNVISKPENDHLPLVEASRYD